ncbi:unnamed protein product (macronuclear) [Paramecium tetraurelia]|uniref:Uncharacterized protein n=1 Tax=Paramecium tetraurelia TaxID=5888 RepID=A0EEH8_PARTE|nr:uncharacterized protein GSPATT00026041001 [Paramecium tetraurelia]CAK93707.1 unnamed protein product [Paramecium tetraurelia]|eukprot:XP_001461092.1 hypothetical protein (macronuclear) [Paramecium tetraurelia strain d4-2]
MQSQFSSLYPQFNDLEEIRQFITSKTNTVDLSLQSPPFLSSFFQPLRKQAFQNYFAAKVTDLNQRKMAIYKFIQLVDIEILSLFSEQIIKPYQNLILVRHYGIPQDLDVEKLKLDNSTLGALNDLASSIAQWNLQIEIVVDNITRVQLYDLWVPSGKVKEAQLTAEIKGILSPADDFDFKTYSKHILIRLLAQGAEKFGKYLYSNGLSESNLSYGAALVIYHALVGKSALPWNVIIPNVSLKWLFGGVIGSLALGKVSTYLEKCDQGVQKYSKKQQSFLINFNETLNTAISEVLLTVNEEQEKEKKQNLANLIDQFLQSPESIKDGQTEIITCEDIIKHEQDEWQVIQ